MTNAALKEYRGLFCSLGHRFPQTMKAIFSQLRWPLVDSRAYYSALVSHGQMVQEKFRFERRRLIDSSIAHITKSHYT